MERWAEQPKATRAMLGSKPHLLAPEPKRPSSRGRRRKGTQAQGWAARKGIGAVVKPRWPITQCPGSSLVGLSRPSRQCQQQPLHLSLIPATALGPFGQKQRWQKRRLSSGPKRRRQGARAPALGSGLVCFPSGLLVCRPRAGDAPQTPGVSAGGTRAMSPHEARALLQRSATTKLTTQP